VALDDIACCILSRFLSGLFGSSLFWSSVHCPFIRSSGLSGHLGNDLLGWQGSWEGTGEGTGWQGTGWEESWGGGSLDQLGWEGSSVVDQPWGSVEGDGLDWGGGDALNDGRADVVGLDSLGEVAGLVDGLLIGGVGGDWADDSLVPVQLLLGQDGLGHVLGVLDSCWLDGLVCGRGVDVGGLSHWDGPGGQLGGDLGEGVGLGGGVGEVAAQPVGLDGGRVVGWGAHNGGGRDDWGGDGGDD